MAQRPAFSTADTTLSRAQPGDLDPILAIEQQAFPTPWSRAALAANLGSDGFIVCCYENRLVGYILVGLQSPSLFERLERLTLGFWGQASESQTVGHVMNLAIHGDFRGAGLGRHLLQHGLMYLWGLDANRIDLEVRIDNTAAIQLYHSEGFAIVKRIREYYQNGDDAFLMSLKR